MGAIKQRARANELRERGAPFLSSAFALARVAPLIGEACAEVPDSNGAQPCSVAIVRVKRGRVTVRFCFPSGAVVYAKVYESEAEGRRLYATQCAVWKAGFNSTSLFRVPEPLAFLEEEYANVVLMTEARGAQLSLRIAEDPWEAAAAAMRAAARWLLYFHASHLPGLEEESSEERSKVFRECDSLLTAASAHPLHGPALREFLGYVHELGRASTAAPPLTPVHGSLKPTSFFFDAGTVTAIDLDLVSLSDPALDVAKFISKVKYHELFKVGGSAEPTAEGAGAESSRGVRLAAEFLNEYARSAGRNLANLRYYLALYCLKEFGDFLIGKGVDASARDCAERLCRTELQTLREGLPRPSLVSREEEGNLRTSAIELWSALCATPTESCAESRPGARAANSAGDQPEHTARLSLRLTTDPKSCLYAKFYPGHVGRHCAEVTAALRASRFGSDSRFRVPEIAAYVPDRSLLLMHAAQGVPLSAILETGSVAEVVRGARDAGYWLGALHHSTVRVGAREHDWVSLKAFEVPEKSIEVCTQSPALSAPLLQILRKLKRAVETLAPVSSVVQTHGSYHPKHVFVAEGVTTAIDLDRSLPADPAKDVAEFVAGLRSAVHDGRYDREMAQCATEAFVEAYLSVTPGVAPAIACYSACYLTQGMLKNMMLSGVADCAELLDFYQEGIAAVMALF